MFLLWIIRLLFYIPVYLLIYFWMYVLFWTGANHNLLYMYVPTWYLSCICLEVEMFWTGANHLLYIPTWYLSWICLEVEMFWSDADIYWSVNDYNCKFIITTYLPDICLS